VSPAGKIPRACLFCAFFCGVFCSTTAPIFSPHSPNPPQMRAIATSVLRVECGDEQTFRSAENSAFSPSSPPAHDAAALLQFLTAQKHNGAANDLDSFDLSSLGPQVAVPVSIAPPHSVVTARQVQRSLGLAVPVFLQIVRQNVRSGQSADTASIVECLILLQCASAVVSLTPAMLSEVEALDATGEVLGELEGHWRQASSNVASMLRATAEGDADHGFETVLLLVDTGVSALTGADSSEGGATPAADPSACFNAAVLIRCMFAANRDAAIQCLLRRTANGIVRLCEDLRACVSSGAFAAQNADVRNVRHPCVIIGMQLLRCISVSAGHDAELAQIAAFSDVFPALLELAAGATNTPPALGMADSTLLPQVQGAVTETSWGQAAAALSCANTMLTVTPKQAGSSGVSGQIRQFRETGCIRSLLPLLDVGLGWQATASATSHRRTASTDSNRPNSATLDESFSRGLQLSEGHTRCLASALLTLEIVCQAHALSMPTDSALSQARMKRVPDDLIGDSVVAQGAFDVLCPLALRRVAPRRGPPVRAIALRVLGTVLLTGSTAASRATSATNDPLSRNLPASGAKDVFSRLTVPVTIENAGSAAQSQQLVFLAAVSRLVMIALQLRLDARDPSLLVGSSSANGALSLAADAEQQKLVALIQEQRALREQQLASDTSRVVVEAGVELLGPSTVQAAGVSAAERNNAARAFGAWLDGCDDEAVAMASTVTPMPKNDISPGGGSDSYPAELLAIERFGMGAIGRLLVGAIDTDPAAVARVSLGGATVPVHIGALLQGQINIGSHGRATSRILSQASQACISVPAEAVRCFLGTELMCSLFVGSQAAGGGMGPARILLNTPLSVPGLPAPGEDGERPPTLLSKAMSSLCLSLRLENSALGSSSALPSAVGSSDASASFGLFLHRIALLKMLTSFMFVLPADTAAVILGDESALNESGTFPLLVESATEVLVTETPIVSQQRQLQQVHVQGLTALLLLMLWTTSTTRSSGSKSDLEEVLKSRVGFGVLTSKLSAWLRSGAFQAAEHAQSPLGIDREAGISCAAYAAGDAVAAARAFSTDAGALGGRAGGGTQWPGHHESSRAMGLRWSATAEESVRIPMMFLYETDFATAARRAADAVTLRVRGGRGSHSALDAMANPPTAKPSEIVDSYKELLAAQTSEIESLQHRNRELELALKEEPKSLPADISKIAELETEVARLAASDASTQIAADAADIGALAQTVSLLEQQLQLKADENSALQASLAAADSKLREVAEQRPVNGDASHELVEARASCDRLAREADEAKRELVALKLQQQTASRDIPHLSPLDSAELATARAEAKAAKQVEKRLQAEIDVLRADQDDVFLALAQLEIERNSLAARLAVFERSALGEAGQ
jgi:uncharacterized protein YdbL (DUF1318 family)